MARSPFAFVERRCAILHFRGKAIDLHLPQDYDAATQAPLACQTSRPTFIAKPPRIALLTNDTLVVFHMNSRVNETEEGQQLLRAMLLFAFNANVGLRPS